MLKNLVRILPVLFIALAALSLTTPVNGQRRDYMTDAEIELVRDAQNLDMRIDVLMKMIDRRLAVLGLDAGGWKPAGKQTEKWGEEPTGTRVQLLNDVRLLLQKGIDDVDDVAIHNTTTLAQNRKEGQIFPKAVRLFGSAAQRYRPLLRNAADQTRDEKERGALLASIEYCDQIIEAVGKLPPETAKSKKN